MTNYEGDEREWLEPDGLGGFAMGTVSGVRTRRYHGLLLTAATPPTGRMMLVNGFDAWVETPGGRYAISSQRYASGGEGGDGSGVVHPDGASRIESFIDEPWPTWTFRLEDGTRITQEIVALHGESAVIVTWRLLAGPDATASAEGAEGTATASAPMARVILRPFLSGRDYHSTHHENGSLRADADRAGGPNGGAVVVWRPYAGVPAIVSCANARYDHQPDWYRRFSYTAERARGLDDTEDLWTPGWLTWELESPEAVAIWHLRAETAPCLLYTSPSPRDS